MRITLWADVGDAGDHPTREQARLFLWGGALERMGHEVSLFPPDRIDERWSRYVRDPKPHKNPDVTIILASAVANRFARDFIRKGLVVVAQPVGRKILTHYAWDADFIIGSPNDTLPQYKEFATDRIKALGDRYLGVHFPPFIRTLEMFDRDGTMEHYLTDDLAAIRSRYGAPEKRYDIGYRGNTVNQQTPGEPVRSQVFAYYHGRKHFEFQYARDDSWYQDLGAYLRFLSECRLTMAIVGDRIKTHRHVEAPMMGSPVIVVRDQLDVTPLHTDENSVLLRHWFDEWAAIPAIGRAASLVDGSDKAYCEGWSLRGQMKMLLGRVEKCRA